MNFSANTLQTHSETRIGERHNALNDLFTAPRQISHLQYTCNLDIDQVADNVRQTSIVCTLGKSWKTKEGILKMMDAGMNIMLINLSMTPRDICKEVIQYAREIEKESGYARLLGIAMDMTAAPVRTGIFEGGPSYEANLKEGARVTLTLDDHYKFKCTPEMIFINTKYFPQLINCLRKGDKVYLDDGQVSLIVKDVGLDGINCMVEEGGIIGSYKRVTLPRDRLYQESVQLNYINDLKFAADFAEDSIMIHLARNHLPGSTKVFAKLETRVTIKNLHDLIAASDGLVIRRSDLAMQYTPEKIFKLQKYIVAHCNIAEKPVFIIEQLLESMVSKPRPTRAESSDIANAVLDGADGLVLTMETSWGMYPLDSVHVVDNVCREAERAVFHFETREELKQCRLQMEQGSFDIRSVTGASAAEAAASCNATAIFVITTTGASATSIAMLRPPCSVIAITLDVSVARHCLAYRGLHSYVYTGKSEDDWALDIDNRINAAIEHSRITGLVKGGDRIIVVTGSVATSGSTNTMHIFTLEEEHSKLRIVGSSHEVAATGAQDGLLNLADRTTEQQQNEQKDEEELDALEEIRLIQGARSHRPRFSVFTHVRTLPSLFTLIRLTSTVISHSKFPLSYLVLLSRPSILPCLTALLLSPHFDARQKITELYSF
ncbi:pyruvate kinase [Echinococcus multilocularis]|uniref:Pyruvate kinase n=1 Tax=Echinococcus multilocularis TaxID=6211 RepID=A0A068YK29_ECHMU|nr:pyruvate kinase [Echinococcus multilocularis]